MGAKLTTRQQVQLAWLESLPPKFDRIKKVIELMSSNQADESQQRALARLLDELKAQAGGLSLTAIAEGFGFMHESYDQDNPKKFTREWFAWANTLFGELIVKLGAERPSLIQSRLD